MKIIVLVLAFIAAVSICQAAPDRLDPWYRGFNHKYFQDELPANIIITHDLHDDRFMAQTEYSTGFYHIEFNPKYNVSPVTERETLIHEMCHVRMAVEKDEEIDQHGPHWQACMMDLAKQGAFKDLW